MKISYIVLSHNLPEQLHRLVAVLDAAESTSRILVHHDAKSAPLAIDFFARFTKARPSPKSVAVTGGDFSQVEAVLVCLRYLLETADDDWIIVLSGQDFPLRPLAELASFLATTQFDAFVEATSIDKCSRPAGIFARYYYRHMTLPRFPYAYRFVRARRLLARLADSNGPLTYIWMPRGLPGRLGIRSLKTPFSRRFVCYQGSDWLNLSWHAAAYALREVESRNLARYYRHTAIPSESLFQTILFNSSSLSVCARNLRWIKWSSANAASPETLGVQDYAQMIGSGEFFARKFDVRIDPIVLDMLEQRVCR